jgi:hypothetical protein
LDDNDAVRLGQRGFVAKVQDSVCYFIRRLAYFAAIFGREAFDRDTDETIGREEEAQAPSCNPRFVKLMSIP